MEAEPKKVKLYTEYKIGERWDSPTTKLTIRIPVNLVEGFLKPYAAKRGSTVAWWASILLMHGVATYVKEFERCQAAEKEHRKAAGYAKRSLRRYGIEPTEGEIEDYLAGNDIGDYIDDIDDTED